MRKRILSFVLSAVLLLAPMASVAEETAANYYAGELTTTAVGDSYFAGNQINLNAVLGMTLEEGVTDDMVKAVAGLLNKSQLHMSFYDDFGTARLHAEWDADGVTLLSADALVYEDGSVQIMSSLTGKLVLALPAQDAQQETVTLADFDLNDPEQAAAFRALPAAQRLMMTGNELISLLINHLLGWVSYMQTDNDGEFYVFDDTYLEATETRDPVAQRMLGTIKADSFNTLLWNVAATIADTTGEFQQALADLLAEYGVTRYQARTLIDRLFTEETIDPALDFVQPSYNIIENKDESPIQYDDVSYFFKKLMKCTQRIWDNGTENVMKMDVSYDDFGGMVGFDAYAPQFTPLLPYEGNFTYSIKTDDNWQRFHTAHGELQVYNDNRAVGDLSIRFGQDVDGENHSSFAGRLDVLDQKANTSEGFSVEASLDFVVAAGENGQESENFEGSLVLSSRENGEGSPAVGASVSGMTTVDAERFDLNATAAVAVAETCELVADVTLEQAEYEEIAFAGGQAINLKALDDETKDVIKGEIKNQSAKLALKLVTKPDVLANLMTIFGKLAL
ncbi:MAG: hypothetical protein ACI4MM_11420 [Candidatus Ventricola sp.]